MGLITTKHRGYLSAMEREAISELHGLLNKPGLLRASFVCMRRSCGRSYCRCLRSKRYRHQSWYVVQRHHGKPRMQHVSRDMAKKVQQWIERYGKIKGLLDRVSDVYWQALKK